MRARLVVFPIKGRKWCFTRAIEQSSSSSSRPGSDSSSPPPSLKVLWRKIASAEHPTPQKAEIMVDFVADKMSRAWTGLEKAPDGTIKSKLHSLGVRLLSRVKPSEIFLKSISKDITRVEVTYPASLNPRLVRRRLRHVAMRGYAIHKQYFYGSVSLLPLTAAFSVLPLPNIPLFWILFRAYSNWRALQGSERLLLLVSDSSKSWGSLTGDKNQNGSTSDLNHIPESELHPPWVLKPSEDLERQLEGDGLEDGISSCTVSSICKKHNLEKNDVLKYRDYF